MTKCTADACPPLATCKEGDGYIYCDCPIGKTGYNCTDDDPCLPNMTCPEGFLCYGPCDPNIVCIGATGLPHCRGCVPGYTGIDCKEDVDECKDYPDICENNGTCQNVFADFKCLCTAEWTGKECRCRKGTECDIGEIIDGGDTKSTTKIPDTDEVKEGTTQPGGAHLPCSSLLLASTLILTLYCLHKLQV